MQIRQRLGFGTSLVAAFALAACSGDGSGDPPADSGCLSPSNDDQETVQRALIEAEPGATLCFAAGTFSFTTELSLDVDDVTLIGEGQDATILDFSAQDTGANGLLIRSDRVTVQDLQIRNPPGDGIRGDSVAGIAFRRVSVIWDAEASPSNGGYGLYPVSSTDVTMESCLVKGASDAGLYVGQTQGVVIVSNEVYGNVAGIEIENSSDGIIRDNYMHDNTVGILALNIPDLPILDGKRLNIFENRMENNNLENFAFGGTFTAMIPHGLGMTFIAMDDSEVHDNEFRGNGSLAILLLSNNPAFFPVPTDPNYDSYTQGNFIHDNVYEGNGADPAPLVANLTMIRPVPDILWDGCVDATAPDDGHLTNCISEASVTYLNFDICTDPPSPSQDLAAHACTYDPLPTE